LQQRFRKRAMTASLQHGQRVGARPGIRAAARQLESEGRENPSIKATLDGVEE